MAHLEISGMQCMHELEAAGGAARQRGALPPRCRAVAERGFGHVCPRCKMRFVARGAAAVALLRLRQLHLRETAL